MILQWWREFSSRGPEPSGRTLSGWKFLGAVNIEDHLICPIPAMWI